MRNTPKVSVMLVFFSFVPRFRTITVALGSNALCWSLTVPPMAPAVLDWARAASGSRMKKNTASAKTLQQTLPKPFAGDPSKHLPFVDCIMLS